jgi:subtilase family serine protease
MAGKAETYLMTRLLQHLAGALALTALTSCAHFQAPVAQARARVASSAFQSTAVRSSALTRIDESRTVTLTGNTNPLAQPADDQGLVSADTAVQGMLLSLTPTSQQQDALAALLAAQQDPASPSYHQWLTPAEFGARFGVSAESLALVERWLKGHGFTIDEVAPSARLITFSGNAAQVQDAFHTALHRYLVNGVTHMANAQDPEIPAALASVVAGAVSLNDFHSASTIASRQPVAAAAPVSSGVQPMYSAGSTHYLFPADFASIYNVSVLSQAGLDGTGVTIAVAGRSNILLSDVASFRSTAGLSVNAPTVVVPGVDPGLNGNDRDEATLDVEWAGAVAPAANVTLVAAPSTSATDGIDVASAYIVNHNLGSIVSVSYANCERAMTATELSFYNALWKQAAAQGQTVFVSSGDSGAAGCQAGAEAKGTSAAVNGMCSSPYATCVGGTQFNDGSNPAAYWASSNSSSYSSALSYIPETVWNESALNGGVNLWASGGGPGRIYTQPTWQAAVSGAAAANGMRAVPDLALNAAAHDGSIILEGGTMYVVSGTSVAAPALAGIFAMAVQKAGQGQGSANARFYALAASTPAAFHVTPSGNNTVPGVAGYTAAGATYNLATGLGSVNATVLVENWIVPCTPPDFTLTASATSGSIAAGASGSFTLQVEATGSAISTVTLTAIVPAGITVSFGPASVVAGSSTTVTLAVAPGVAAGNQQIVVTGADAYGTQSVTYTLNVRQVSACTSLPGGINAHCGVSAPI